MEGFKDKGEQKPRIVMLGAGAVGGYVGGYLSEAGYDVTLVDFWHEHIETIRRNGLQLIGLTEAETQLFHPRTLHMHEVGKLRCQGPVDIAFVCMKSYDTAWITTMIKPYLAPSGYVVSLQNCINEETIAEIVGRGKSVGCIAPRISVELFAPGRIRRQAPKGAAEHTVFRVGEVHGGETDRIRLLAAMLGIVDGTRTPTNLWGESWSKLCHNAMRNGIAAAAGLSGREIDQYDHIRNLTLQLGAEAVTIGRALGYELERIGKLDPDLIVQAAAGNPQGRGKGARHPDRRIRRGWPRRAAAPVHGAEHGQGPAHRDRGDQRLHRAQGEAIGSPAPHNAHIEDIVCCSWP